MKKSDLSIEEKLDLLIDTLALVALASEDETISLYCAKILEDIGEFQRILNKSNRN